MTSLDILRPPQPDPGPMLDLIESAFQGLRRSYLFLHALDLGTFEHLKCEKTVEQLSELQGTDPMMTRLFCEALCSMGLLSRADERYVSSPAAAAYLTASSPYSLKGSFERTALEVEMWHDLSRILRVGPAPVDRSQFFDRRWVQGIAATAVCGSVQKVASELSAEVDLKGVRKMLDLGGGHGLYAIALSALNPDMEVIVFDLPEIVPVTWDYIAKYSAESVKAMPGDFTKDDIGSGYDLIYSSFNPSGSDISMISKLKAALVPGGLLVVRQFTEEAKNDAVTNLGWNFFCIDGERRPRKRFTGPNSCSIDEYNSSLVGAGFELVKRWSFDERSEITIMRKKGE